MENNQYVMDRINIDNINTMINETDHKSCPLKNYLILDLTNFLQKNSAISCSIVLLNIDNKGQKYVF